MVFFINGVDIEAHIGSWPYLGPVPKDFVCKYRVIPNTEPRMPHSYMQRAVFGNEPFEFRSIDPSTVDQPFGPLESAPGVLAPTAAGRPAAKPSSNGPGEPWDHFLYRLATSKEPLWKIINIDDYPPDYPPRSVEVVLPRLGTAPSEESMVTVQPTTSSNESVAEVVAECEVDAPSTVEELSFSAIPIAPSPPSGRRPSVAVAVRSARTAAYSSAKIAQATKAARLLGSISGPIRPKRSVRSKFANTLGRLKGFATGKYPSERLSFSQY